MDVGTARGWSVWQLENDEWAWGAWAAENLVLPQGGVEPTEAEAQEAARRALDVIIYEARAADQQRRRLTARQEDPR